jgi:hypothetical protein
MKARISRKRTAAPQHRSALPRISGFAGVLPELASAGLRFALLLRSQLQQQHDSRPSQQQLTDMAAAAQVGGCLLALFRELAYLWKRQEVITGRVFRNTPLVMPALAVLPAMLQQLGPAVQQQLLAEEAAGAAAGSEISRSLFSYSMTLQHLVVQGESCLGPHGVLPWDS